MSLLDLIRVRRSGGFATATLATVATHEAHNAGKLSVHPPTVASVATVAVATTPSQKVSPLCALIALERLHGEHRARLIDRPGAIARVRLDHWGAESGITFERIIGIARALHEQQVIVLEHGYVRPAAPGHLKINSHRGT